MADSLDRECDVFARYLTGVPAGDYLRTKYREAHGGGGPGAGVVGPATGSFDSALVGFARSGTFATRLADAHARLFANGGLLRRKLVLMLALLECSAPERVDAVVSRSITGFFFRAAWLGVCFVLLALLSLVVLLPLRLVCALFGSGDGGEARAA